MNEWRPGILIGALTMVSCLVVAWLLRSGCTLDVTPRPPVQLPPPPMFVPVAHDTDAGDDEPSLPAELMYPQPERPKATRKSYCDRPAYRNKRECKSETRLMRRHELHHRVGC